MFCVVCLTFVWFGVSVQAGGSFPKDHLQRVKVGKVQLVFLVRH